MSLFKKRDMAHLENGELPWGWVTENSDFIENTGKEYTCTFS